MGRRDEAAARAPPQQRRRAERREGVAHCFFGDALRVRLGSNQASFVLRASSRAVSLRYAYLEMERRAGRPSGSILDALPA